MQHEPRPTTHAPPTPHPRAANTSAASPDHGSGGLADVVVADTRISEVDGQAGQLIIAGQPLAQLVERGFEGAAAQLWDAPPERVRGQLGAARTLVFAAREHWQSALAHPDPLGAQRLALAQLPLAQLQRAMGQRDHHAPDHHDDARDHQKPQRAAAEQTRALLCACMTVVLACWLRQRSPLA
ncbi:MAG TPA: hypothetical protein ENK23_08595, partial [Sorangium sp.]|nr:hypothetical protein [Sorangium sp.]